MSLIKLNLTSLTSYRYLETSLVLPLTFLHARSIHSALDSRKRQFYYKYFINKLLEPTLYQVATKHPSTRKYLSFAQ